jgi:RNA polymerase sigma factor (sigma-70 family)
LDRNVGANAEATSLSGVGSPRRSDAVAFATTHWSIVLTAQSHSSDANEALEKLCRTYWQPIFSFLRLQGIRPEEAEDLTQGFFALILERRDMDTVRKEKGRLRSYLLVSLKHFLADERRRAMAAKRGKGQWLIPLEQLHHERLGFEQGSALTADQIYERRWALTVLEHVLARLRDDYRGSGNMRLFNELKKLLMDEPDRRSQAEIAAELNMTENAVKQAFHRFRRNYQLLLREEIAQTVATPSDIEDEIRHLIAVVRA